MGDRGDESGPGAAERRLRVLNRDGTFNVARVGGLSWRRRADVYHRLTMLPWPRFIAVVVAAYLAVNVAFALGYLACGPGALEGTDGGATSFLDAFFFSVQTFATIGYGKLTPRSLPANLLVTLEALVGLLAVALATGLVFARFSRPTARVLFSERAAIAPHDGVLSLVFRMANERRSQIVQAEVSVTVIRDDRTVEGETYRSLYDLALERHHSPFFTLSWTVVHPIDEKSPLRDIASDAGLRSAGAEIMVSLVGIDDALAQTVHARFSYAPDDIVWGGRFADILERRDGLVVMDLDRFHDVEAPTGG